MWKVILTLFVFILGIGLGFGLQLTPSPDPVLDVPEIQIPEPTPELPESPVEISIVAVTHENDLDITVFIDFIEPQRFSVGARGSDLIIEGVSQDVSGTKDPTIVNVVDQGNIYIYNSRLSKIEDRTRLTLEIGAE